MLTTLMNHLRWADRRTADALDTLEPPAELVRIWAHVLGAEETWLARIIGRDPVVAVWPELDRTGCRELMARNHDALGELLDAGAGALDRGVTYRNSRGEEFTNTVSEILHHVAMHGMYHRGQVALEVRRLGGEPLATDLIVYLRAVDVMSHEP